MTISADTNHAALGPSDQNAKSAPKIVKLSDGGGLQCWVTPEGAKRWRLAYGFGGKQRALAIGVYPAAGGKPSSRRDSVARIYLECR